MAGPKQHDEERHAGRWYGKYRAFVRDIHDPERLGRCRLEIPAVLGEDWSEWAWPCFPPMGGNPDQGMFLIPEEGASVWAEFEGGDPTCPIWSGIWIAGSNPGEQPTESERLCTTMSCLDCPDYLEHARNVADNLEHRKYHGHPAYYCPKMRVLIKTETGHTILADDRDGTEMLRIIDRVGQILEMVGPVKPALQTDNALPRGTRTAADGTQLSVSDLVGGRGHVQILDACRQMLRFEAWQDGQKVHLVSCDAVRSRWQKILLDTTAGREALHIWGLNGTQVIRIDSRAGGAHIYIKDAAGNTITLSGGGIAIKDKSGSTVVMSGGGISVRAVGKLKLNT